MSPTLQPICKMSEEWNQSVVLIRRMKGAAPKRVSRGLLGGREIPGRSRRASLAERMQPLRRKE